MVKSQNYQEQKDSLHKSDKRNIVSEFEFFLTNGLKSLSAHVKRFSVSRMRNFFSIVTLIWSTLIWSTTLGKWCNICRAQADVGKYHNAPNPLRLWLWLKVSVTFRWHFRFSSASLPAKGFLSSKTSQSKRCCLGEYKNFRYSGRLAPCCELGVKNVWWLIRAPESFGNTRRGLLF